MSSPEESTISITDSTPIEENHDKSAQLVLAMQTQRPAAGVARFDLSGTRTAWLGRGAGPCHAERTGSHLRIQLNDGWLSATHLQLKKTSTVWSVLDCDSKNGTYVNGTRVSRARLRDGDVIEAGGALFVFRAMSPALGDARLGWEEDDRRPMQTMSASLEADLQLLARIAPSSVPLLLMGETGTGKEVIARWIHTQSSRQGEWLGINCGALPQSLVESELFGFTKGAFSGAHEDRPGLFRAADDGTLLLDEIDELSPEAQVKLLRVLQEQEVLPVGSTRPVPIDVRVLAATHRNLLELTKVGAFRKDLYARLAGFVFRLPPLRARKEDLGLLTMRLTERIADGRLSELRFDLRAARALFAHDWPLNVRELEQALRAALALAEEGVIKLEHLPETIRQPKRACETSSNSKQEALRAELDSLLRRHQGNISAVARELDRDRVQVRRWCRRFRIDPEAFRAE